MTDFLLELRSEEIPARMQAGARADLEKLFRAQMDAAGLSADSVHVWSTPRRLALIARGLPLETQAVSEERKGPRADAPAQALEGFLRSTGLTRDQLVERDVKGQAVLFAIIEKPGRATRDVLAEAIPAIIRAFPWPKSMRWGTASQTTESLRWVRPLSGIVALLGDDLVECAVDGVASGYETRGHRFHHHGDVTIGNAADYAVKLRAAHVIVDHEDRQNIIRDGAAKAAADAGLVLVADEGLVIENAGLTEWPVPLLGRFDPAFLEVPQEVIQLTARVNQKYFVCHDSSGALANAFVCTANIAASDGGAAIVAGNKKVLAARLSDARFFWEQDQKKTLEQHAVKLQNIVFHEKLGTVADKVERVAKLARWLVEEGIVAPLPAGEEGAQGGSLGKVRATSNHPHPSATASLPPSPDGRGELAALAEQAARLCKADLVTEMVGEFPELQGLMGGYYAAKEGLDPQVAAAIRDHYKPVGQGDDVPTAPVTVAVSLADKLDTLVGFFAYNLKPSGSKDPFALRRAVLSAIATIEALELRLNLSEVFFRHAGNILLKTERSVARDLLDTFVLLKDIVGVNAASDALKIALINSSTTPEDEAAKIIQQSGSSTAQLLDFFAERLKVQQREAGVRHDLIDAVFALGGEDDLVRLLARVRALQAFVATPDGVNLLAGYKRAANILKQSSPERGGGPAGRSRPEVNLVEGQAIVTPTSEGKDILNVPLHHPADGSPPRAGEDLELQSALDAAEPQASAAIAAEDFAASMTALASLRVPIDAFFDGVMVNDPDPAVRAYRMGLLTRFRDAVHQVADFSKIEG